LFVKVQNGYEMDELHDVSAQNPANNDGLFYNTTSGLWEKKSIVTALGYTPVNRAGDTMTGQLSIIGAGNVNGGNLQLGDKAEGTNKWSVMTGAHFNGVSEAKGVMLIGSYSASGNNSLSIGGNVYEANPATYIGFYTSPTATHPTGGFNRLNINGSGIVTAEVEIRAPIFRDSDNPAFYADFAGTSSLSSLLVGDSGSTLAYNAAATGKLYFGSTGGDASTNYHITTNMENFGGNYSKLDFKWYTGQRFYAHNGYGGFRFKEITTGNTLFSVGEGDLNVRVANAIYSPVYYDSPDTSFYFDGSGATNLNNLYGNGKLILTSGDSYLRINEQNAFSNGVWYGPSNIGVNGVVHLGSNGTESTARVRIVGGSYNGSNVILVDGSNGIISAAEMRAPIFRDSNNAAYFLDPSETSQLKTVEASGGIGFRTFSNGSSGINSQFYFANAANSRAWNWQLDENNDAALWNFNGSSWNKRFTFTAGSNFTAGGNIGANAGIFTNDGASRVLYLKGSGNIIQFQDADGTNRWENVGRNGTYYVYKGYGVGEGFKWQIDDNGNQIFNGIATFNTEIRAPIFRDSNDTSYYVDPNSVTRLNKLTAGERSLVGYATLSMAGLDVNTYYPVTIPVPVARQGTLRIENALNSNAPSWSTHPSGFSCYFEWTTNGLGWGTIGVSRRVTDWRESFTSVQIVGGIDQMTFSSQEVIWLRGGGNYYLSADFDVAPTIRTTSYELYGQTVAPRSSPFNDPWETAIGKMSYGTFQATGSTSLRTRGDWRSDSSSWTGEFAGKIQYHNNSWYLQASNAWIFRDGAGGEPFVFSQAGSGTATGDFRAPIFRDSNNTAYFIDPSSNFSVRAAYLNGNILINPQSESYGEGIAFLMPSQGTWGGLRWKRSNSDFTGAWAFGYFGNETNNDIGFHNGTNGWRLDHSFNMSVNGSVNAPIFRDLTNTGYYWDIADGAVSSVNTQIVGFAYFRSNFGNNVYSGSVASPPLQAYSNDGSTAMMSFHRAGAYAVNMGLDPDNVLRIGGWSASANRFQMDMSGNLTMAGNVTAYSDGRLKEDVATVVNALDLVGKMRGVTYTRKDTGEAGVGVIAQEMLEVLPEVVQQGIGDDDTLSVAYGNLVGVLIEAIKELSLKVKTLEEKDNSI
jgi:hypothetical protein